MSTPLKPPTEFDKETHQNSGVVDMNQYRSPLHHLDNSELITKTVESKKQLDRNNRCRRKNESNFITYCCTLLEEAFRRLIHSKKENPPADLSAFPQQDTRD